MSPSHDPNALTSWKSGGQKMTLTAFRNVHRIVRHIDGALLKAGPSGLMRDIRNAARDTRPLSLAAAFATGVAVCRIL
jgi:hypothetical protein